MNGIFDLGAKCHVQGGDRIFDDIAEYTWKHASRSLSTWKPTKTLQPARARSRYFLEVFPYIPYLLAYPSGPSPALSSRRKNTGVNLK